MANNKNLQSSKYILGIYIYIYIFKMSSRRHSLMKRSIKTGEMVRVSQIAYIRVEKCHRVYLNLSTQYSVYIMLKNI